MIAGLHHIAINVAERDRAVSFYRNALGFTLVSERARPEKGDILLFLEGNGVVVEMFVDQTRPPRPTYPEALGLRHLCFAVTDIVAERARIASLGYTPEPIRETGSGRMFFVLDPDGLPIELHE